MTLSAHTNTAPAGETRISTQQNQQQAGNRTLTYTQAILEATDQMLASDESMFVIGEGVPDPKGIFGTTIGLQKKYGAHRVMDMPLAENAITGMCIGAGLMGMRPMLTHQRIDFTLLAIDQVVSNAAKWHYMFGGQLKVPIVIRMVIGEGWGQGAQHSQNLQALYAHIPGLKVIMPSTAYDAKGMLISAIKDNNPVIYIEHRWLHNTSSQVPEEMYEVPIGPNAYISRGDDITIAATSYLNVEVRKAVRMLAKEGISVDHIDVRTLRPFDDTLLLESSARTGRFLAIDSGHYTGGFAAEMIARVCEKAHAPFKCAPQRITLPDFPAPSTPALTKYYYPRYKDIVRRVFAMLGRSASDAEALCATEPDPAHWDVPDASFKGPF